MCGCAISKHTPVNWSRVKRHCSPWHVQYRYPHLHREERRRAKQVSPVFGHHGEDVSHQVVLLSVVLPHSGHVCQLYDPLRRAPVCGRELLQQWRLHHHYIIHHRAYGNNGMYLFVLKVGKKLWGEIQHKPSFLPVFSNSCVKQQNNHHISTTIKYKMPKNLDISGHVFKTRNKISRPFNRRWCIGAYLLATYENQ